MSDGHYSFPLTSDGHTWSIREDFKVDHDLQAKILASATELQQEREAVKDLLGTAL